MSTISVDIPDDLKAYLDAKAEYLHSTSSSLISETLMKYAEKDREELAIKMFNTGKISLGKAAEIAGVTERRMMELLCMEGVTIGMSVEHFDKDYEIAKKVL